MRWDESNHYKLSYFDGKIPEEVLKVSHLQFTDVQQANVLLMNKRILLSFDHHQKRARSAYLGPQV